MTAHELAKKLLKSPDLPVLINGWGSDEGTPHEVERVDISEPTEAYQGQRYMLLPEAIILNYD